MKKQPQNSRKIVLGILLKFAYEAAAMQHSKANTASYISLHLHLYSLKQQEIIYETNPKIYHKL